MDPLPVPFAGYLATSQQPPQQVYYSFFEAEVPNPATAPLVLWQQG